MKLSKRQKPMVMALIAIAVIVSGTLLLNQKAQEERTTPALQGTARITPESQLRDERPGGQLPQGFEALIAGGKKARIRMNEMRMRGTPEAGLKPEFDESLRYLNKALEKASKDPKSQETMRALMELGTTYNDHNDRQKALETYQAALDSVEKNNTPINISDYNNILCSIGTEYECLQQYDKSEAVKLRALKAAEEKLGSDRSNPAILSGTLESLAILYTSWGKFDKAEEYARRSLYNKSRLTDSDYEMLVYPTQVLGWALLEQGKTRQGYELLHKAAAMGKQAATHKRSIGTAIIFADGLHYLGYAYERLGKKDKAKEVWAQQKMIHASVRQGIVPNIENINP